MNRPKVALYFSDKGRKFNLQRALELIKEEIFQALKGKNNVVLKPNLVNENFPLGLTHRQALQAIVEFIEQNQPSSQIIVAEDCAIGETWRAMGKQGYFKLKSQRPLIFKDLKLDERLEVKLFDRSIQKTLKQHIYQTLVNADFLVSVAIPKTHDTVVVTLSLKNIFVGALYEKAGRGTTIHQGYPAINRSLAELARYVYPHLGVIDGWTGMEGEGPSHGDPKPTHFAACSLDPLALDIIVAKLMGFQVEHIGYLYLLAKERGLRWEDIEVVSNRTDWESVNFNFKPHSTFDQQVHWQA